MKDNDPVRSCASPQCAGKGDTVGPPEYLDETSAEAQRPWPPAQRPGDSPLTQGRLLRALTYLAWPMLVTALLQNVQSLIDLYWVGRLGHESVASVAMSGTLLMMLFPMLMGISTGTVALVARAIGAGRPAEASAAAAQSLLLAMVLGGLSGGVGLLAADPLLRLLGADPTVMELGGAYLRINLLGSFTAFALFNCNAALQGAGDSRTPMLVMAAANVANIVLDPLFIFGFGPLPAMGVQGAALATVLAQALAAALAIRILLGGRSRIHIRLPQCRPDVPLAWRLLRIGIPGSGQMLSRSLMGLVMMGLVASCGTTAVAAYGIGLRIHIIVLMPAFALGGAAATLVGQNLGAGQPERARRSAWLASGVDVAFMAFAALFLALLAPQCIAAFSQQADVIEIGARYLRIVSPSYLFAALGIVLSRGLQGAGDTVAPMIITIVTLWGLQVPLAMWLSHLWQPATEGIWYAMVIAGVMQGLLTVGWFELGRWKKARV